MSSTVRSCALVCRAVAPAVAKLGAVQKSAVLHRMARALQDAGAKVLSANAEDVHAAPANGTGGAMMDRLRLDETRVAAIVTAVHAIANLPDPVGQITQTSIGPNGLRIEKISVPLGVIATIYEARPNVTADAAALCPKAGNGVILRAGSKARHSNRAIATALQSVLPEFGIDAAALTLLDTSSRFSDGGELGLGAEIGISTTRLHAYGPMGAESLTIERFVVHGDGQIRHSQNPVTATTAR